MVMLKARSSDWGKSATTDANGEFASSMLSRSAITLSASPAPVSLRRAAGRHRRSRARNRSFTLLLKVAATNSNVTVSAAPEVVPTDSATPITLVDRLDIAAHARRRSRTNSLAMITDYVPGAYVTHDQLHIRGGHQISWLVDGVTDPNTNIASNVGPQFDPKDIDYMEVIRGSYGAEFGDRTYGVFNVVPRTGFRTKQRGRAFPERRQLLPDQRRDQLRQPHRALRLLCQPQRQPQRSRPADSDCPGHSRCRQWLRRLRFADLQCRSFEPASPGHLAAQGLLPDSLRSRPELCGKLSNTTAAACATASTKAMPSSIFPGFTRSIRSFC